jgi:2-polyprenyl-6-methoxyphenol hydroxylase-like FAD-dependent oxidoreductase
MQGWTVTVHERASGIDEGGTALGMWPEAVAALDDLGLRSVVDAHSVLARGASILAPSGALLGRIPGDRRAQLVSRGRLLEAMHDAVPPGTVRWSTPFAPTDALPDADLVVAADGIHSAVRTATWSSSPVRPLHTVAFRGVVDRAVASVTETWGEGALFGITPTSDGRTNWFACVRSQLLDADGPSMADALRRRFGAWHPAVVEIVSGLRDDDVDRRELSDVAVRHRYVRGNIALLGDAAHAMAPNLGRGACESLLDAVALAHSVGSGTDLERGLDRYDRMRRGRTRQLVRAARLLNRVATAGRGAAARDLLTTLLLRGSRRQPLAGTHST